ncbi:MAG TPA: D-alanine--D-alanine ligase [Mycobacterium sp.]|nr:D-alanine--D-alanine ligase [Mycobacterium sp.]
MSLAVLHLVGSAVDEFHADLSRLYAGACLQALADPERYEVRLAYVSPDGSWRFPSDLGTDSLASAAAMSLADAVTHLGLLNVDVVVPQMFCLPGMTSYRALFDVLGIPYVGNGPAVMAIAADKAKARAIVAAAGVAVPAGEVVRPGHWSSLPLPVVVKPVDADNSVGVSLVRDPGEYDAAIDSAMAHGGAALVESYVELGREVRCGIVVRDGELVCLPLEEYAVDSASKPIRGQDDKLDRTDDGDLYLVAKDPSRAWIVPADDPINEAVWDAARRCHLALGCRHYSLFDFRIDPDGRPWFLEAGPYCSFAPSSVVAVMAAASGVDVADLFADALGELDLGGSRCLSTTH